MMRALDIAEQVGEQRFGQRSGIVNIWRLTLMYRKSRRGHCDYGLQR